MTPEEREHEQARAAHQEHYRWSGRLFDSVLQMGEVAMTTASLTNGGAAVAMLAFVGTMLTTHPPAGVNYDLLLAALAWFAGGVLCSTVATGGAYLAQSSLLEADNLTNLMWAHPYKEPQEGKAAQQALWEKVAEGFRYGAATLVFASYACMATGGVTFWRFAHAALPLISAASRASGEASPAPPAPSMPAGHPQPAPAAAPSRLASSPPPAPHGAARLASSRAAGASGR